jgi:N-acetylneuraminic acid mutarotase
MSKNIALFLVLVSLAASSLIIDHTPAEVKSATENSWTTKTPLPDGISIVKAAVVNGKIYVMGYSFNYEYDPDTDSWTAKTPMPTPRNSNTYAIAACQDKIYVIGGDNGENGHHNYLSTNEAYDPSTDTWETKKSMPTSRKRVDANVVDDKIYVIGGVTDNFRSIEISVNEVYDPATDSWTTKQPAPITVQDYASAVVDKKIYIMFGYTLQVYDAENDTWTVDASIPISIEGGTAAATAGVLAPKKIYVIGGGHTITLNAVRVYDPASGNWTLGSPMPTNRTGLEVAVVDDVLYAMGGATDYEGFFPVGTYNYTSIVEQYIPFGYGTISPESFPAPLVIMASGVSAAVACVGLLVYFKKRKR